MNTLSNPSIDRNDLVNLISKSQEYIEILKSIISVEDLQSLTSESLFTQEKTQFSSEDLCKLEENVSQCQGQSKNVPVWRSKSVPLGLKNIGY
jgi:hypothetical protein